MPTVNCIINFVLPCFTYIACYHFDLFHNQFSLCDLMQCYVGRAFENSILILCDNDRRGPIDSFGILALLSEPEAATNMAVAAAGRSHLPACLGIIPSLLTTTAAAPQNGPERNSITSEMTRPIPSSLSLNLSL